MFPDEDIFDDKNITIQIEFLEDKESMQLSLKELKAIFYDQKEMCLLEIKFFDGWMIKIERFIKEIDNPDKVRENKASLENFKMSFQTDIETFKLVI